MRDQQAKLLICVSLSDDSGCCVGGRKMRGRSRTPPPAAPPAAKRIKEKLVTRTLCSMPRKPSLQTHRKLYDEGVYAEKVWQNEVDDVLRRLPHPSTISVST